MEKEFKFVGFWKRVWMALIDSIILIVYAIIIYLIDLYILRIDTASDLQYIYYFILLVVVPILTVYLLWITKGASFGKLFCKTRIVDIETGEHPSNKQFLYRLISYYLSNNSFLLSFIHVGLDSRKQAWHDKLAKTVVVKSAEIEHYKSEEKHISNIRDKKYLKIEVILFIIFIICFILFKFFQFYDEPLLPGANDWLYKKNIVEKNPKKNGFYFLVGFDCLEGDNPIQEGYNWIQNQNKKATNEYKEVEIVFTETWTDEEKAELDEKNKGRYENDNLERVDLNIIQNNFIVNDIDNTLDYYVNNQNLIDSLIIAYSFLNERYKKINSFPYFDNTLIPHYKVHSPIFLGIVNIKRLNLAWIGKEYKNGNKQKAIAEFSKEIELSRFLLKQTHSLIGKLVAIMMLEFDLRLLSDLIDESESDDLNRLLPTNLTTSEKYWKEVAISNFNQSISSYLMFNDPSFIKAELNGKISAFFFKLNIKKRFKLNKLISDTYNTHNFLYHLSQLNAKKFIAQKENYPEFEISFWDKIFNPAGSIFVESAVPIYQSYISQFHDIDGYINMLKLKVMIKDNHLKSHEIQSFIEAQSDSLFNPYTEKAIMWNPKKSILYFGGPYNDDSKLKELKIKL